MAAPASTTVADLASRVNLQLNSIPFAHIFLGVKQTHQMTCMSHNVKVFQSLRVIKKLSVTESSQTTFPLSNQTDFLSLRVIK